MAEAVDLAGLRNLLERGARLLEVLPREEYDALHLLGALHLPLKELGPTTMRPGRLTGSHTACPPRAATPGARRRSR